MPVYMLSVHPSSTDPPPELTPEEQQAGWAAMQALEQDLRATGAWLFSARLADPSSATVVRRRDGETLLTDGPYAEAKEHMGGFYLITADDLDEALAWAAKVVDCVHMPIEVWPVADHAR